MKTPYEQEIKLTFKVTFGKAPEYNATYTMSRYVDAASFQYGNQTGVHVRIENSIGRKDVELYDTRYDSSVADFDKWCESYFENRFDPKYEPTVTKVAYPKRPLGRTPWNGLPALMMAGQKGKEMNKLLCAASHDGYDIDQIRNTMTVGELIDFLSDFNGDTPVYLSFDNGYTYGGITMSQFEEEEGDSEDE